MENPNRWFASKPTRRRRRRFPAKAARNRTEAAARTVEWTGPIFDEKNLTAEYRSAMLFVYPSVAETGEALPVAPLEAMANGCAPLVSNLLCFRDYIEDGVNGFVFDHRGENAQKTLAERLEAVLQLGADNFCKSAMPRARKLLNSQSSRWRSVIWMISQVCSGPGVLTPMQQKHVIPSAARDLTSNLRGNSWGSSLRSE